MLQPRPATGFAIIRICIGVFLVFEGLDKLAWLTSSAPLIKQLSGWAQNANPISAWYLRTVVYPGVEVFARLVVIGELSAGLALVFGVWPRLAAGLAFLMVLNFQIANGLIFQYRFLTSGYGLPVLGALLGLAIGCGVTPWSVRRSRLS